MKSAFKLAPVAGILAGSLAVFPVFAGGVEQPQAQHRSDLTPKDRARVSAITKPATDFSKPEKFN